MTQQTTEEFMGRLLGDMSATTTTVLAGIGDRLGLFRTLAEGAATSDALAARAQIAPRYAKEWCGAMASAGYVHYDPSTGEFTLPAEHVPVLAHEGGPAFAGGMLQMMSGLLSVIEPVVDAFRTGGGVAQAAYPEHTWDGMDRFTMGWHENLLVQEWVPAVPGLAETLERGADVCDVGCGRGRAALRIAQTYPNTRVVGYDVFEPNVERARKLAANAGLTDRVRFECGDVSKGIPERVDVVTTFDVVHDAADPQGLLRAIRAALKPAGVYLCLDINCAEHLEDNAGPLGALFHGFSVLYCMTTSLAAGGEGLGTVGLHEAKLNELAAEAGFTSCERVSENPFNNLYALRA